MKWYTQVVGMLVLTASFAHAQGRIEAVGPDTVDFGRYPAWEKRVARYRIRNSGKQTLKILKVRKGCGCASAVCSEKVLQPGEQATVDVTILPNSIFNAYAKKTYVESSDRENRFMELKVKGNAIPLVGVSPNSEMQLGRLKADENWHGKFSLEGNWTNISLGDPTVKSTHACRVALSHDATNAYSLVVSLDAEDTSGDIRSMIKVPVEHPPDHAPVSISLSGRAGSTLVAIPQTIRMTVSDMQVRRRFQLRILDSGITQLSPETVSFPEIAGVEFKASAGRRDSQVEVVATFSADFTKMLQAQELLPLLIGAPGMSSAQILCRTMK